MDIVQSLYQTLCDNLRADGRAYDFEKIEKAFLYASEHHGDQRRSSGEPYICHPLQVAIITHELGLDSDSIIAAILHDTIEDTEATFETVKNEFGKSVAELVDGVTKIGKIPYSSKEEEQIEYLRKMFFAMAKDLRVIIIKLADRLHNVRTLGAVPAAKQLRVALETMEIYAPLAHRLGMQKIKIELEDTCLSYLDPVGYKMIVDRLEQFKNTDGDFFDKTLARMSKKLEEYNIKFHLEYRVKHIFSIYRKLFTQNKAFEEIFDVYAFRVIVDSPNDCYFVLGLIHDAFNPIPGRFKDYISTPKQNMYQSLHTTVIGKTGIPFEVQIRTWDMHNTAEYGIAAHWKYKSGVRGSSETVDTKLHWIRSLLEANEVGDTEDFISGLKVDLFSEDVFVFTPKGDVIDLPLGANLIDFAYSIHSAVGNKMIGAKVNGKIVPFDYKLSTGEIVEVLTTSSATHGPSRNWMKIATTSEARNKIRQYFKKECREENIQTGQTELDKELRELGIRLEQEDKLKILEMVCDRMHYNQIEDLYSAIGYGGTTAYKVANKVRDIAIKMQKEKDIKIIPIQKHKTASGGVVVEGIDNCLVKFAKCCSPLPGDYICGFITKGYGVSIHKVDCPNAKEGFEKQPGRWLKAHWDDVTPSAFTAAIRVETNESIGVMASVASAMAEMKVSIHSISAAPHRTIKDHALISMSFEVRDVQHLNSIISRLERLKDVIEITRI